MRAMNGFHGGSPDDHLAVGGASCALWWRNTPRDPTERIGAIGQIAMNDRESGVLLLSKACEELRAHGCTLAIGPMDGNTWRSYRAVTERGAEPPFFLEPDHPDHVGGSFGAAGFTVAATYVSALQESLEPEFARIAGLERQAEQRGIRIRALDMTDLRAELRRIHALCMASFQGGFLFAPIGEDEFVDRYLHLGPCLHPELALLAENSDSLVAFLFALPDALEVERGEAPRTVIVKSVASLPGIRQEGIGSLLTARATANACRLGFRRAIHALMHEANGSAAWSARRARPMRRYALFARRLSNQQVIHP